MDDSKSVTECDLKSFKIEGDPKFVVLLKEVGELSTLPVKITQVSSYQDDMDRETI